MVNGKTRSRALFFSSLPCLFYRGREYIWNSVTQIQPLIANIFGLWGEPIWLPDINAVGEW